MATINNVLMVSTYATHLCPAYQRHGSKGTEANALCDVTKGCKTSPNFNVVEDPTKHLQMMISIFVGGFNQRAKYVLAQSGRGALRQTHHT